MKLHFEPNLDYQQTAIESVCALFQGQEICRSEFTVQKETKLGMETLEGLDLTLGVGNRLKLLDDEIHTNLKDVQLRNGLRPSESLASGDFTVEMETGTGKTYVYLRSIFELNRRYGFTKFVIVVPSVAIKEGVYKSLQITEDHFRSLYANTPYEYFLYDSSKLGQVRNFATSSHIQIMVVTVGAINKKEVNNIYGKGANEDTNGEPPINLIKATRPIIIVDEPQSVDGGLEGRGKSALDAMHPLCTLRYSATHADKHHMVYRLDAVDAYERKLVKQIEVASGVVQGDHNTAYIRVLETNSRGGSFTAMLELDVQQGSAVARKSVRVEPDDDLEETTGRVVYRDFRVGEIRTAKGSQFVEIRSPGSDPRFLGIGESIGGVAQESIQRQMIRRTIKEHLDKELRLKPMGIKVLSLFFIDHVEKYRATVDGNTVKGEYALIFEEEFRRAMKHPDYADLFKDQNPDLVAPEVHEGYFSIDKKGGWTDTQENNQANRENAERAYNLIMKDKERLLSFATPLKFIFSHSALREGWDNPNVFQICALREMGTERERRQTIGRGLRLCVNQQGERVRGFDVNTLTVVAMESYQEFAENLQKEIETDTGIRFGIVEKHQFAGIPVPDEHGRPKPLGVEQSEAIWSHLKAEGLVDAKGKVQDSLRKALKEGTLALPEPLAPHLPQVTDILRKLAGKLEIKNADERRTIKTRQAILHGYDFKALWDRIKHKTTYRVDFDNEELVKECVQAIKDAPSVPKTRLTWHRANLAIGKGGVDAVEKEVSGPITLEEQDIDLPDILTELQNATQLTRRTIARILMESNRLKDFKRNPQAFIEIATESINKAKRLALVDGIKYQRLGNEHYYAQELFEQEELTGYLKNMVEVKRSIHEYVVYDSAGVEKTFAEDLEKNEAVKVYAKLPGWFKVPTPLGTYNPDWAVLVEQDGEERLYFVVETKGSQYKQDLRDKEWAKIKCGQAHFDAIGEFEPNPAQFTLARTVDDLLAFVL